MNGTLSERTKYILRYHPKLMSAIVSKILEERELSKSEDELLSEIIEKFKNNNIIKNGKKNN